MDIEAAKSALTSMTHADHMGDINDDLPRLCAALDLPAPTWCDEYESLVMDWDKADHLQNIVDEQETNHYCKIARPSEC